TRLDITDRDAVRRLLAELRPDVVINAAAFTAVDAAETEIETCRRVNADAVAHLAAACRETGGALMQISTDYVFAARGRSVPWQETDPPLPLCRYAADKLLGEQHARTVPKHFVVRTCGLYGLLADGRPGRNFVESMLRLAKRGDPIRVVDDQRCSPTYVPHLAAALRFLLESDAFGLYHVTASGSTTWHDFAAEVFRRAEVDVELQRITTADYPLPAKRPSYSVLDTSKYESLGGPAMPAWQQGVAEYLSARPVEPAPGP
ncbi:MAG: dTDP-4-dehydrorhamnose reductase, partial [Planctomycetales bacterium]|nr:dTDP-4-dehydrorhamnose reductase [Planctomycetales bacterium]